MSTRGTSLFFTGVPSCETTGAQDVRLVMRTIELHLNGLILDMMKNHLVDVDEVRCAM